MEQLIEKIRIENFQISINYDVNPIDPRDPRLNENLGTLICWHSRYKLGDLHYFDKNDHNNWEELRQSIINSENVHTILPIYMYEHSGLTISTNAFSCRWDSGQIGFIYISKNKVNKENLKESDIEEYLTNEIKLYNAYLSGEIYGYSISKIDICSLGCEHLDFIDSCYGFYSKEDCKSEAMQIINNLIKK